jgi:hypothetical protein
MVTGGLMNLMYDLSKPLANRKAILFQDQGCFTSGMRRLKPCLKIIHYMISDHVKNKLTEVEKVKGYYIAHLAK